MNNNLAIENVVYVADIGADIDDLITIEFLHTIDALKCVVLDGKSTDENRIKEVKNMGIEILEDIPAGTDFVFCGGSFTKIAKYLRNNKLKLLVANGGFAGCNVVQPEDELPKFKGKTSIRTFNLNMDVNAGKEVLDSKNVDRIILVSKNVCHSEINVRGILHKDEFLNKYKLKQDKRLHDLLMAKEGILYLNNQHSICDYMTIDYILEREKSDVNCRWGSKINYDSNIYITVGYHK